MIKPERKQSGDEEHGGPYFDENGNEYYVVQATRPRRTRYVCSAQNCRQKGELPIGRRIVCQKHYFEFLDAHSVSNPITTPDGNYFIDWREAKMKEKLNA